MKAVQFDEHGGRDVLEYASIDEPEIGPDEALVEIKAGALNHLDVFTREGLGALGRLELELPHIPGSDAAGIVLEVGNEVDRFESGDRVTVTPALACRSCEHCRHGDPSMCNDLQIIGEHVRGVHAEKAAVPAANLVSVPEDVDWETAAAAPLVFQTAWRMLVTRADLGPGEEILVLGANGGVGHAAVQIADHIGATVIGASTEEHLQKVEEIGAEHAINHEAEDITGRIQTLTDDRGVDVVVDHVGAATWQDSLHSLVKGGRIVTCGATTGRHPETDLNAIFWNQLEIVGSTIGTPGEMDDVLDLVWDGAFRPQVRDTVPMSEIDEAHELIETEDVFGKVVVVPDSEYDG
ncbi:MAG: zinc-binding dehydrogenase [Natronomonas sp.]